MAITIRNSTTVSILLPINLSPTDKELLPYAKELKELLEAICEVQPVITPNPQGAEIEIHIGETELAKEEENGGLFDKEVKRISPGGARRFSELDKEGFCIVVRENFRGKNVVFLYGRTELGTRHAVYTFLERYCGVRWFFPDTWIDWKKPLSERLGTFVPSMSELIIPDESCCEVPAFLTRYITFAEPNVKSWEKHNKMQNHHTARLKGYSHNMRTLIPSEAYANDANKEIYAFINGKRQVPAETKPGSGKYDDDRTDYCYSYEKLPKIVFEKVEETLNSLPPGQEGIHISRMDGAKPCECPKCTGAKSFSDLFYGFINKVAQEVRNKFGDKYHIGTMAYGQTIDPPDLELEANVNLYVVVGEIDTKQKRERALLLLEKWQAHTPNVCVYSHQLGSMVVMKPPPEPPEPPKPPEPLKPTTIKYFQMPAFYPEEVQAFVDACRSRKILGYVAEMLPVWMFSPRAYLTAKMLWNPKIAYEKILKEMCDCLFGPGSEPMLAYFQLLENIWGSRPPWVKDRDSEGHLELFFPYISKLSQLIDNAVDKIHKHSSGDLAVLQEQRVRFYANGLETLRLLSRSYEVAVSFNPFPATAGEVFDTLRGLDSLLSIEVELRDHFKYLEDYIIDETPDLYPLSARTNRSMLPRDRTHLVSGALESIQYWFGTGKNVPIITDKLYAGNLETQKENIKKFLDELRAPELREPKLSLRENAWTAMMKTGVRVAHVERSMPVLLPADTRLLIHESFESEEMIRQNGGIVRGRPRFEKGIVGNACYFYNAANCVEYPLEKINPTAGTVEFFMKLREPLKLKKIVNDEEVEVFNNFLNYLFRAGNRMDPPGNIVVKVEQEIIKTFGVEEGIVKVGIMVYLKKSEAASSSLIFSLINIPPESIDRDEWMHVAASWGINWGKEKKTFTDIYVNGRKSSDLNAGTYKAEGIELPGPIEICRPTTPNGIHCCVIDELRVYDRPIPEYMFCAAWR